MVGAFYVKPENWQPFAPNGWKGIMTGAALVFFAYIGFDAISTAAEETKNPQKNLPIGIITSLVITTILYIAVAIVLTGMIHYSELNVPEPLAKAFNSIGLNWAHRCKFSVAQCSKATGKSSYNKRDHNRRASTDMMCSTCRCGPSERKNSRPNYCSNSQGS